MAYDVQGNLANKNGASYAFDYGNRLRGTAGLSYRYDAHGLRVRQDQAGAQLRYSMYAQDGRLVWQRDEVAGKRINNVYLGGSLIAESSRPLVGNTATLSFLHTDALGSPVAKTNAAGAVIETSEYEPYGQLLNRANDDRAGYTGHVMDAVSGLIYMQQRYYDPQIGRFLSVDPVTAYSNPVGAFNRYLYANNNPYRFADPDGRQSIEYGKNAIPLSSYSEEVLRQNMRDAGVAGMTITSTYRSPEDQARVMHQNVEAYGVKHQMRLYGPSGREVVQSYADAKKEGLGRADTIAKMAGVINKQMESSPDLYKHSQDPSKLNTVDIKPSSVQGSQSSLVRELKSDSRISNVLTPPKDPAIHVEIPQKKEP